MPHMWKTLSAALANGLERALSKLSLSEVEMVAKHAFMNSRGSAKESLAVFATIIHELEHTSINHMFDNGESWLIDKMKTVQPKVIFDIGANIGEWTEYAAKQIPAAEIHSFEIVPRTFDKMRERIKHIGANVRLNPFGLSDQIGEIDVRIGGNDYTSSIHAFISDESTGTIPCQVQRGDAYARERGISFIDFIKIDVEGAEGTVIKGMSNLLEKKAIRLLQFEYNKGAIESKFLLRDFYNYLTPLGYTLGKLTPQGVAFREYAYTHEDFSGPNYVACLKTDQPIINLISAA